MEGTKLIINPTKTSEEVIVMYRRNLNQLEIT